MNMLVNSGLALTLVSASAFATDTGWVSLDQEIHSLNASLSAQNATGPKLGGYIRSRWATSSDDALNPPIVPSNPNNEHLQGFLIDNVRIELTGDAGSDYSYKVSFDLAGEAAGGATTLTPGGLLLKDAYVKFKIGDYVTGKMGQFKANFLRSSTVRDQNLLFLDRTLLGDFSMWNTREPGLEFAGSFDTIGWSVSAQNGIDGVAKKNEYCAKVSANLIGGGVGKVEGAYGAGDGTALSAGLAWMDDGTLDKGSAIGAEVALTAGPFSVHAEIVDLDDNIPGSLNPIVVGLPIANTTPWDLTASYLFTEAWEAMIRYEDLDDDADDSSLLSLGVNYYVAGHDIKWTAQWQKFKTDNAIGDTDLLSIGLTVSM